MPSHKSYGLAPDRVVEEECGSKLDHAIRLSDLGSAVETVIAEWEYDEDEVAATLVAICRELDHQLGRISLRDDGSLTLDRECSRCSGAGKTTGEDPCIVCGGRGSVHADEAED